MKTITAKEFQLNHAKVVRDVQNGQPVQVTFHRQPIIQLIPIPQKSVAQKPKRGSYAAFLESLKYTVKATSDLQTLSYKELRDKMMEDRHGKYFK